MRKTKEMNKKKMRIGTQTKAQRGITLIALVITIIVMLILVAVTISMAINGGLFNYAGKAAEETKNAIANEQELANLESDLTVDQLIDKYTNSQKNPDDEVIAVPETYTKSFQAGDNITAYLVEQEEGTEEYNLLFIGTGAIWDRSLWIEELATYHSMAMYYMWDYTIENVELSYGITNIPYEAFVQCADLISITIPSSVTSIGNSAFSECESLTSIIIPEGLISIGDEAFCSCDRLESVTISSTVTSIGDSAFVDCDSLTTVNYTGTAEQWSQISVGEGNDELTSATINYV